MKNILNEKQIESIEALIKHLQKKTNDLNAVREWYEDINPRWQDHLYHLYAALATFVHAIDNDLNKEQTKACIYHLRWVREKMDPALNLPDKLDIAFYVSLEQIICDLLIHQSDNVLSLAEIKSMDSLLTRHQIYIFSRVEGDGTILSGLIQTWINQAPFLSGESGFFSRFSRDRTIEVLKRISPSIEPAEYLETVRVSLKSCSLQWFFLLQSKESALDYALIYRAISGKKDFSCQKSARTDRPATILNTIN